MQITHTRCQCGYSLTLPSPRGRRKLKTHQNTHPQRTRRNSQPITATTLLPSFAISPRSPAPIKISTEPSQVAVCATRVRKVAATAWSLVCLPPQSLLSTSPIPILKQSWPHPMIWLRFQFLRSSSRVSQSFMCPHLKKPQHPTATHWTHGQATKLNLGPQLPGQKPTALRKMTRLWD